MKSGARHLRTETRRVFDVASQRGAKLVGSAMTAAGQSLAIGVHPAALGAAMRSTGDGQCLG
eukprot:3127599-Pyramimonas_sp.AAC.1